MGARVQELTVQPRPNQVRSQWEHEGRPNGLANKRLRIKPTIYTLLTGFVDQSDEDQIGALLCVKNPSIAQRRRPHPSGSPVATTGGTPATRWLTKS